jgi:hypothetical protein
VGSELRGTLLYIKGSGDIHVSHGSFDEGFSIFLISLANQYLL